MGAANDAQDRFDGAEGRRGGLAIKRDCLIILFVLLRSPADVNGSDGCRERVGDVGDGDFSVLKEGEVGLYEGLW